MIENLTLNNCAAIFATIGASFGCAYGSYRERAYPYERDFKEFNHESGLPFYYLMKGMICGVFFPLSLPYLCVNLFVKNKINEHPANKAK
jgi:hypothetical protein